MYTTEISPRSTSLIFYFEIINFDCNFLLERSETSDSRPYTTSNLISEPSLNEHNPNILQHETGQNIVHFHQVNPTELLQNQEPQQFNIIQDPQQITKTLQDVPDPSKTATVQNISELSDDTLINPQSLTITKDSNTLQIPVHDITQNPNNNQDQNSTTHNTNPDNISTLSTSNTNVTQKFQPQQTSPRNYGPPSISPQYLNITAEHNSPQQGNQEYFKEQDLETSISRHNNPHYWLIQDILQIKQFQYRFFQNIIPKEDTVPQIKVLSPSLPKFFRFNFQIIWEQQDQNAYFNFPQVLIETELLPFIISDRNKHVHYRDLTSFNIAYFLF